MQSNCLDIVKMDWTTIITSIIGAVVGGGGIGAWLYRKENKRGKEVENEKSLADGWKELAEGKQARIATLESTIDRKDEKIDTLYMEMAEMRSTIDDLRTENAVLRVYKCIKVGCEHRQPPFGMMAEQIPQIKTE